MVYYAVENDRDGYYGKTEIDAITATLQPTTTLGVFLSTKASAPSDTACPASTVVFYLDEASNLLKIKAKYSTGTATKGATITLS